MALDARVRMHDGLAVVDLAGDINADADAAINAAYDEAAATGNPVLLHFDAVTYINSTGIALIVGMLAKARSSGIALLATGLNEHYTSIFEITRLVDFVQIHPDEASAVAACAKEENS